MYKVTEEIKEAFDKAGLSCTTRESGDVSAAVIGFTGKKVPRINIIFVSTSEYNDFSVRVPVYMKIPEGKRDKAIETCNKFNFKYRYCKFMADDEGNIAVVYDVPAQITDVKAIAVEVLTRFMRILDEVYPDFIFDMLN